jgi:hypothetical protein
LRKIVEEFGGGVVGLSAVYGEGGR